jgi:hypothetical protein
MKLAVLLTLATLTTAHAAEEFGGFNFHSTVAADQIASLKSDIKYLYQNPVTTPDAEFISTAEVPAADGVNLHNFLINRVRYIIGQSFELSEKNIVVSRYKFPTTPLPATPTDPTNGGGNGGGNAPAPKNPNVKVVMTNMGGALYIGGKSQSVAYGVKFDGKNVYIKSPRAGLLQVGEGLFLPRFMLNKDIKAPANAIFRLSTLFHEARHSDGNSAHTGFLHEYCPVGHPYAGFGACEISGNGSYTIGALSNRHLLKNCTACSPAELSSLQANVLDSLNRIIPASNTTRLSDLKMMIDSYTSIIDLYTKNNMKDEMSGEISKLQAQVEKMKLEMAEISSATAKAPFFDSKPEGEFEKFSLDDSKRLMTRSLR